MSDPQESVRRAEEHLAAATIQLTDKRPYLGAALWAMRRVIVAPSVDRVRFTMAVSNRWTLYIDPETVLTWSVAETASVLYHEVLHLLRIHAERCPRDPHDPPMWNFAADAEINDDLRDEKLPLPGKAIFPETLGCKPGKLAEEYWTTLLARSESGESLCKKFGIPIEWWYSSGATGVRAPWETKGDSVSPEEAQAIRQQVARDTLDHARQNGNIPDHLKRWADTILSPTVDWRTELATLLRAALGEMSGMIDYSYRRPSRRQSAYGKIVAPSLRQPKLEVALVVDTSGSMGERDLADCLAEIDGVLRSGFANTARVLTVDAAVHSCQQIFAASQLTLAGGGGTDMGVGIEAAALLKPKPSVIIVLTDGYTPWPAAPQSNTSVLVVLTQPNVASHVPTWAKTIVLPERK